MEMHEILKTGQCGQRIAVSKKGAAPSIPTYEEVEEFLKENQ